MIIKLSQKEGIKIARFARLSRFTLAVTEEVKSELKTELVSPGVKMVFNLKGIEFIDSSGIGCIIALIKSAKNNGSMLRLCNLSKEVQAVFDLLHLQSILEIYSDEEACIESYKK